MYRAEQSTAGLLGRAGQGWARQGSALSSRQRAGRPNASLGTELARDGHQKLHE